MTHPDDDRPHRTLSWPGLATGLVGVPFTIFAVDRLMERGEPYVLVPAGVVLLVLVVVRWRDPFWRGVRLGMLAATAIGLIVLAGLCIALVRSY